jgi:DNA-binding MarR family transcriptional regulator/GNAT superfamily N-acetyltransferase
MVALSHDVVTNPQEARIAAIRGFNRFYTQKVGALDQSLLRSGFSLAEARVLYEIAHRSQPTAAELAGDLRLDPGYLSRVLRGLEDRRLIRREAAPADQRQSLLSLTEAGREAFAPLDRRSRDDVAAWLTPLADGEQRRLIAAMEAIAATLGPEQPGEASFVLRNPVPGDMGWVVHRQGLLYAQEYDWDATYEALVAEIVAKFVHEFDPRRERCWIAERRREIVGSVFLVRQSDAVAKLRLLYVEPSARGLGIGSRLVEECIGFARQKGYAALTLWTNDILVSARRIYQAAGFHLVSQGRHASFGKELVGQTWELTL